MSKGIGVIRLDFKWRSKCLNSYKAVIKQDDDWWIGWFEEVPGVNCQEATREKLLETLRITLQEAIQFN